MQSRPELVKMILLGRKDVHLDEANRWADCLLQLQGCKLFSVASPEYDQADWLKMRTAGIGGSEIAAIMGENHWNSPRQIWLSKMGMFDDKPSTQSEAARWGNLLETAVATEWGIRNNRKWIHIPVSIQHADYPWMLANIDGFTLSDDGTIVTGILEVKTTSEYNREAWEEGPLPFNYICQTVWYCGITHLPMFDITCLVGGQKLHSFSLPFDEALFARETEIAKTFWLENVKKGIEPLATEVDKKLLKDEEHDESLPAVILEDDESNRLVEAYVEVREKMGVYTKVKDALNARITLRLGEAAQAITKAYTITLSRSARRKCDMDKLNELYPDVYKDCVSTSVSKILRIK